MLSDVHFVSIKHWRLVCVIMKVHGSEKTEPHPLITSWSVVVDSWSQCTWYETLSTIMAYNCLSILFSVSLIIFIISPSEAAPQFLSGDGFGVDFGDFGRFKLDSEVTQQQLQFNNGNSGYGVYGQPSFGNSFYNGFGNPPTFPGANFFGDGFQQQQQQQQQQQSTYW